jgi:hypothetical protein
MFSYSRLLMVGASIPARIAFGAARPQAVGGTDDLPAVIVKRNDDRLV